MCVSPLYETDLDYEAKFLKKLFFHILLIEKKSFLTGIHGFIDIITILMIGCFLLNGFLEGAYSIKKKFSFK